MVRTLYELRLGPIRPSPCIVNIKAFVIVVGLQVSNLSTNSALAED